MSTLSDALEAMDKATPGPWSAYCAEVGKQLFQSIDIGDTPRGRRPCVIDSGGFDSCDLSKKERKANAKVIAAAPDALAFIKEALPWLEWISENADKFNIYVNRVDKKVLDALIARAKPEEVGR